MTHRLSALSLVVVWGIAGCELPKTLRPAVGTPRAYEEAKVREESKENAEKKRVAYENMTFEEFKATVYREPEKYGGKFLVDGDRALLNEKHLRDFYETEVKKEPPTNALTIMTVGGQRSVWNDSMKQQLTYCVSSSFGSEHQAVVEAMRQAAEAWEAAALIDFIYDASEDGDCDAGNSSVVFDVRPVDVNGQYLARAFFPNEPRSARNVLIDDTAFELDPNRALTLTGILRHELGHTLGFRHEHTRPESGACFEDNDWEPLTDYDPFSVMHYPQCNGLGDWSLTLTHLDQNGVACVYGPAAGFTMDPALDLQNCRVGPPSECGPRTQTFEGSLALHEEKQILPAGFSVAPGTTFEVTMTGTGDPDLYVRFDQAPTTANYHCRPYLTGPNETCALTVPAGETKAFVMVRGYTASTYDLIVTHTPSP